MGIFQLTLQLTLGDGHLTTHFPPGTHYGYFSTDFTTYCRGWTFDNPLSTRYSLWVFLNFPFFHQILTLGISQLTLYLTWGDGHLTTHFPPGTHYGYCSTSRFFAFSFLDFSDFSCLKAICTGAGRFDPPPV